jgi:hypothetical protein
MHWSVCAQISWLLRLLSCWQQLWNHRGPLASRRRQLQDVRMMSDDGASCALKSDACACPWIVSATDFGACGVVDCGCGCGGSDGILGCRCPGGVPWPDCGFGLHCAVSSCFARLVQLRSWCLLLECSGVSASSASEHRSATAVEQAGEGREGNPAELRGVARSDRDECSPSSAPCVVARGCMSAAALRCACPVLCCAARPRTDQGREWKNESGALTRGETQEQTSAVRRKFAGKLSGAACLPVLCEFARWHGLPGWSKVGAASLR